MAVPLQKRLKKGLNVEVQIYTTDIILSALQYSLYE